MDYTRWNDLLGRSGEDPLVIAALVEDGVERRPRCDQNHTSDVMDVADGITLTFTDEAMFDKRDDMRLGEGGTVLSGFMMLLQHSKAPIYKGALPFGLSRGDSPQALRDKFGVPKESYEPGRWERWIVGDRELTATYAKDLKTVARVNLSITARA